MFRTSENEFLLCYNGSWLLLRTERFSCFTEFGLYVDRHGDPSRSTGTVEWEGTAEKVAWHPPYILLFDSRFYRDSAHRHGPARSDHPRQRNPLPMGRAGWRRSTCDDTRTGRVAGWHVAGIEGACSHARRADAGSAACAGFIPTRVRARAHNSAVSSRLVVFARCGHILPSCITASIAPHVDILMDLRGPRASPSRVLYYARCPSCRICTGFLPHRLSS